MINKKTYYSISEVSKLLDIQEHTIRFWDSKLQGLSRQPEKGKTRFFSQQQINNISHINNLLKNNDSLSLAYKIASNNKLMKSSLNLNDKNEIEPDSNKNLLKNTKIKEIIKSLKYLINSK